MEGKGHSTVCTACVTFSVSVIFIVHFMTFGKPPYLYSGFGDLAYFSSPGHKECIHNEIARTCLKSTKNGVLRKSDGFNQEL